MKPSDIPARAPQSAGKTNLVRHLEGKRLTQRQAILAKCCDCMGYFVDGRVDCRIPACALYPYMPYREKTVTTAGRGVAAPIAASGLAPDGPGVERIE
jgi:hypothetical protein